MITSTVLLSRLRRPYRDPEINLTPIAVRLRRWFFKHWPFVTKRRQLMLAIEYRKLIHELYLLAAENNRLADELKRQAATGYRKAECDFLPLLVGACLSNGGNIRVEKRDLARTIGLSLTRVDDVDGVTFKTTVEENNGAREP